VYLYFYFGGVENLCHYTLSPHGPNRHELGSWGLGWTYGASPPVASPENHYDGVLFGERCCVAPIRSFVGLGALGEGSRRHEAPHHVANLEFVPDGVGVVWASLLKEPIKLVYGRPC
jgi:hypothetical protein